MSEKAPKIKEYSVHPAADIFPMLDKNELAGLAESIAQNGQRFPIMLWKNGGEDVLIDGRNRKAACELTGTEPKFDYFEGTEADVLAYIADVNLERRDLKKQQKIMAFAMIYPEPAKRGRGNKLDDEILKKLQILAKSLSSAQTRLSKARQILKYADLAQAVLNGARSLEDALAEVKKKELAAKNEKEMLEELHREAPDLYVLVPKKMTLAMAWAAYQQKLSDEAEIQKSRCDSFRDGIVTTAQRLWGYGTGTTSHEDLPLVLEDEEFMRRIDALGGLMWEFVDADAFRAGTERLIEIISAIKEKKYGKEADA